MLGMTIVTSHLSTVLSDTEVKVFSHEYTHHQFHVLHCVLVDNGCIVLFRMPLFRKRVGDQVQYRYPYCVMYDVMYDIMRC